MNVFLLKIIIIIYKKNYSYAYFVLKIQPEAGFGKKIQILLPADIFPGKCTLLTRVGMPLCI